MYGVGDDHQSSLDAQSVNEDHPPTPQKEDPVKSKEPAISNRRASVVTTRPIVTSTTATVPPPLPNGVPKPAAQSTRPPTELKYASAVAAATNPASLLGLGPLPAPTTGPIRQGSISSVGSSTGNPARTMSPVTHTNTPSLQPPPPLPILSLHKDKSATINGSPKDTASPSTESATPEVLPELHAPPEPADDPQPRALTVNESANGHLEISESPSTFGVNGAEETDIAMLPPGLRDLLHSFQSARSRAEASSISSGPLSTTGKMLEASRLGAPDAFDAETKKRYTPQTPYATPAYYPQLPHPTVSDPNFVRRCDVDTLFFMFYYQQETVQQYSRFQNRLTSGITPRKSSKIKVGDFIRNISPGSNVMKSPRRSKKHTRWVVIVISIIRFPQEPHFN